MMLGAQTYAWRSYLVRNAPRLVSVALGALITVELARAGLLLYADMSPKAHQPAAPPPMALRFKRATVDVHGIVSAHLFGQAPDERSNQDPDKAPKTTANLLLAATIATEDPKHGLAIIGGEGPEKVYKVGDGVGGASLHSVYRDHVILNRNGSFETLALPRLLLGDNKSVGRPTAGPVTADAKDSPDEPVPKGRSPADVMRIMPKFAGAGKLQGFRIYPNGNRESFDKSGLRGGDVVVAINGTSLQGQDRQHDQAIFDTLKSSNQATVTVERNGQRRDVTINTAEAEE
jgi:type II secretion system protein C